MFSASVFSSTSAPRTEIYIKLACAQHRPEYLPAPAPFDPTTPQFLDGMLSTSTRGYDALNVTWEPSSWVSSSDQSQEDITRLPTGDKRCNSDPVVQAAVAKLFTGAYSSLPLAYVHL